MLRNIILGEKRESKLKSNIDLNNRTLMPKVATTLTLSHVGVPNVVWI